MNRLFNSCRNKIKILIGLYFICRLSCFSWIAWRTVNSNFALIEQTQILIWLKCKIQLRLQQFTFWIAMLLLNMSVYLEFGFFYSIEHQLFLYTKKLMFWLNPWLEVVMYQTTCLLALFQPKISKANTKKAPPVSNNTMLKNSTSL